MPVACPHCTKTFQPERAGVQFCPHCGGQLEVPQASVEAAQNSPPPPTQTTTARPPVAGAAGEGTPWERRAQLGFGPALFETMKQVLLTPTQFFDTVRPDGPLTDALFYAWIIAAIGGVARIPFLFAQRGMMLSLTEWVSSQNGVPAESKEALRQATEQMGSSGVGYTLTAIVIFPIALIIGAGLLHLCAMLTGAGAQGYNATFRVVSYSITPFLFSIHFCVSFFVVIYAMVVTAIGLRAVHRTTTGKAAGAVLVPLLVCCLCCCGAVALTAIAGAAAASGTTTYE